MIEPIHRRKYVLKKKKQRHKKWVFKSLKYASNFTCMLFTGSEKTCQSFQLTNEAANTSEQAKRTSGTI